jgi:predicted TIM-barrel fold metal-dependent hydrolase
MSLPHALAAEPILEPELVICDPHHHLWTRSSAAGELYGFQYLLDELRADVHAGYDVRRTVYVECHSAYRTHGPDEFKPVGETEWVVGLGPDAGMAEGIVAFADLRLGAGVEDVLSAHAEAGGGRFCGVRHSSMWDADTRLQRASDQPPPGMLGQPGFREGMVVLGRMGLTFDAWLYFTQLDELAALARACPEVTIVLGHLGGLLSIGPYAGRRDEVLTEWRTRMQPLVRCGNVFVKLGGVGSPMTRVDPHGDGRRLRSDEIVDVWGSEFRWCIDQFGPRRCMFESNFPVDRSVCSYTALWNAFALMTSGRYGPDERAALFHDTADRVYGLGSRETQSSS